MEPPEIRLREVTSADLPVLFEHQRDPAAARMAAFSPRDREAFMAHWSEILAQPDVVKQVIECDDRVVGNIGCYERSGRWLVGYWIDRQFWGQGIATRALREFLTQVRERPLHAFVAVRNVSSIRVLEKCGFVREAECRSPERDGWVEVDEYLYALNE